MKQHSRKGILAGILVSATLVVGIVAYSTGDSLISLEYWKNTIQGSIQTEMEQTVSQALKEAYEDAASKIQADSGQEPIEQGSTGLQMQMVRQGDQFMLGQGSNFLMGAGVVSLSHTGSVIDVTTGEEIPSVSVLEQGHRYLVAENTSGTAVVDSGAAYLAVEGPYQTQKGEGTGHPFVDVSASDWYEPAVDYVYSKQLFSGVSTDSFAPGLTMNRAMVVTVFYRLAGSPEQEMSQAQASFQDVKEGSWYYDFVRWGYVQGVTAGMGDNLFAPEQAVTRQQILVMLHSFARNYLKLTLTGAADLQAYQDGAEVADWSKEAVAWAAANGLISGLEYGTLRPNDAATRAEVADILMRFEERIRAGQ